ncbi:uncharacterized protein LOC143286644 [Babylonia areolata]|uniref:uncharacterized protein LOC143286644 n=1 Tax=Babylonia areolata TaxID=304850 RepID=UPI003FD39433
MRTSAGTFRHDTISKTSLQDNVEGRRKNNAKSRSDIIKDWTGDDLPGPSLDSRQQNSVEEEVVSNHCPLALPCIPEDVSQVTAQNSKDFLLKTGSDTKRKDRMHGCCCLLSVLLLVPSVAGIHTVTELKVDKYLGRWYQMYTSAVIARWFEKGATCVTADYGTNPNGTVSVLNQDRKDKPDGPLDVKAGYATPTNETGKLEVSLQGVPIVAPYWVIKLGPETFGDKGLYQYSLVTDNLSASLFVLTRDVKVFREQFQEEVLDFLKENGFNQVYNKPLETVQSDECQYGPTPAPSAVSEY